jgi:hypothetical protein
LRGMTYRRDEKLVKKQLRHVGTEKLFELL